MKILDCESLSRAYESILGITGLDKSVLDGFLGEFDPEAYCTQYSGPTEEGYISPYVRALIAKYRVPSEHHATCWFHLTRVSPTAHFKQGILPTHEAIESIWEQLYELARPYVEKSRWEAFRRTIGDKSNHCGAQHYRTKAMGTLHGGPYAMLIREVAEYPQELGNHDYLFVPEIVEDVCRYFDHENAIDLLPAYRAATVPTIVKFIDKGVRMQHLDVGLAYIAHHLHRREPSLLPNAYFSAQGMPVPRESVLAVERRPANQAL